MVRYMPLSVTFIRTLPVFFNFYCIKLLLYFLSITNFAPIPTEIPSLLFLLVSPITSTVKFLDASEHENKHF